MSTLLIAGTCGAVFGIVLSVCGVYVRDWRFWVLLLTMVAALNVGRLL